MEPPYQFTSSVLHQFGFNQICLCSPYNFSPKVAFCSFFLVYLEPKDWNIQEEIELDRACKGTLWQGIWAFGNISLFLCSLTVYFIASGEKGAVGYYACMHWNNGGTVKDKHIGRIQLNILI